MASLTDLTEGEREVFLEEVIYLLEKGYKIPQVADRLKWSQADVQDLLRTDLGRDALEGSEKAAGQFNLEEADLTMAEARAKAKHRLPHYLSQLDRLATNASSEQVRMAAAQALMKFTGALEERRDEVVEMPDFLVKNLVDAITEAQNKSD
jgi:hypothetical protein